MAHARLDDQVEARRWFEMCQKVEEQHAADEEWTTLYKEAQETLVHPRNESE
jgi:hypothetical protein